MESFFGIGLPELIFIAIIALIVLGPERLPGAIRSVTNVVRQIRNLSNELTSQFSEEFKALDEVNPKNLIKDLGNDLLGEDDPKNSKKAGTKPGAVKTGSTRTTTSATKTSATKTATRPATTTKPATASTATNRPATPAKKVVASSAGKSAENAGEKATVNAVEKAAELAEKTGEAGGVAAAAALATKTAVAGTGADGTVKDDTGKDGTGEENGQPAAAEDASVMVAGEANEKVPADKTSKPVAQSDTDSADSAVAEPETAEPKKSASSSAAPEAHVDAVASTTDVTSGNGTSDDAAAPSATAAPEPLKRAGVLPGVGTGDSEKRAGFKAGSIPRQMGIPAKSRKPAENSTENAETPAATPEATTPVDDGVENSILPPAMASAAESSATESSATDTSAADTSAPRPARVQVPDVITPAADLPPVQAARTDEDSGTEKPASMAETAADTSREAAATGIDADAIASDTVASDEIASDAISSDEVAATNEVAEEASTKPVAQTPSQAAPQATVGLNGHSGHSKAGHSQG